VTYIFSNILFDFDVPHEQENIGFFLLVMFEATLQ